MNCVNPLLEIKIDNLEDTPTLREQWRNLESESDGSFFISWNWIGNWLALKPDLTEVKVLSARHNGNIIALALFAVKNVTRYLLFRSNQMYLHEYGLPDLNMVIEHNAILVANGYSDYAPQQMLRYLVYEYKGWDELKISAICRDNLIVGSALAKELNLHLIVNTTSESKYVNLEMLRLDERDYLDTLSSNTRYQLRRAIKRYNTYGNLSINIADSVDEANIYFDALKVLHQDYWRKKGLPGSFANQNWEKFNRSIISQAVINREVQIFKISAGNITIGYLYNLVRNGHVNMIQSGFNYQHDSSMQPGYVSHYLAIEYNLKIGNKVYDFLMGDARYKRSLSNAAEPLVWVTLQRKRIRFRIENTIKGIVKFLLRRDKNTDV